MNNVIFIYGEDSYSSTQHLQAIRKKYIQVQTGNLNLSEIEGNSLSQDDLVREVRTLPFLAKKRLVIVRNILSGKNKSLGEFLPEVIEQTPESTLLVIFETKVDKRTSSFKNLVKLATTKDFPQLDEVKLKNWVKKEVIKQGGMIAPAAIQLLWEWVGADLWHMKQEIDKLLAYNLTIDTKSVELLVSPSHETIIFTLSDEIIKGSLIKSLEILDNLRAQGEADLYLFSMVLAGYRNLIKIGLAQRAGLDSQALKTKLKVHPFVIQKSLPILNKISLSQLIDKYRLFVDIDFAIKTGTMEAGPALDILVAGLVK